MRRYIICRCNMVYERTTEPSLETMLGSFSCDCGAMIGAWRGLLALRYEPVPEPDAAILATARRLSRRYASSSTSQ